MAHSPPTPVCKSFLVCKRILLDHYTGEVVILGPLHELHAPSFPVLVPLAIHGRWSSVQGSYELDIQLQDLEGTVIWGNHQAKPLESLDPEAVTVLTINDLTVFFPRPGKYEIVMLANSQEVSRDVFFAFLASPGETD